MKWIIEGLFLSGLLSVAGGIFLIYHPLGIIVGGLELCFVAFALNNELAKK